MSLRVDTPRPLWATSSIACPPSQGEQFFLHIKRISFMSTYVNLYPLPLVLSLRTIDESALVFLFLLISYSDIDGHIANPFFLQAEQSRLSQPLLIWQVLHSLNHLCVPLLDLLPCSYASLVLGSPELDTVIHNIIGNVFSIWKQESLRKESVSEPGQLFLSEEQPGLVVLCIHMVLSRAGAGVFPPSAEVLWEKDFFLTLLPPEKKR